MTDGSVTITLKPFATAVLTEAMNSNRGTGAPPVHLRRPAAAVARESRQGGQLHGQERPCHVKTQSPMTPSRAVRILLAAIAAIIVAWSFFDVGRRAVARWSRTHERPITLTIAHWGDKAEEGIVAALVEKFEKENPTVQITRVHAPASDFTSKLKTMMASGDPPDVFYLRADIFPDLAAMKLIRPIDDFVAEDIAAGNKATYDDYFPLILDAFRYDVATATAGKGPLYGLPKDFTTAVMYVNLDLFKKAGVNGAVRRLDVGRSSRGICRKITALSDDPEFAGRKIYGGHFQLWPDSLRNIVWTFGGDYFGPGGFRDVTLDEPPRRRRWSSSAARASTRRSSTTPPASPRKAGRNSSPATSAASARSAAGWSRATRSITNFRWDVVPVPYKEKKFQASHDLLHRLDDVLASRSTRDEAFKLMKFLCSGEGAIMQSQLGLAIPPLKSVAYSDDFLAPARPAEAQLQALSRRDRLLAHPAGAARAGVDQHRSTRSSKQSLQLGETSTCSPTPSEIERRWLDELDSPLRRGAWKPMRWDLIVSLTIAAVARADRAALVARQREKLGPLDRATERAGFAFIAPVARSVSSP